MQMTLGQGQEMTLTLNIQIPLLTQLFVFIYQLSCHRLQKFLKNPMFSFFFKAYKKNFLLAVIKVKVNPGYYLNKI